MKLRTLLASAIASAVAASGAAAQNGAPVGTPNTAVSGLHIDVNIPENRLRLFDGDSLIKTYRVSVGLPGHETPAGQYAIDHAEWNPWWRPPQGRAWAKNDHVTPPGPDNPMGRVKLFFAPYYYIHGSPHVKELGTPASHGCIRMLNADVIELARTLHAHNGGSLSQQQITQTLAHSGQTRWSQIHTPVPVNIRYDPVVVRGGQLIIYKDLYGLGRIHDEAVIQALIAAGYDPRSVDRADVRRVLTRAAATRGTFVVRVADAFGGLQTATAQGSTAQR